MRWLKVKNIKSLEDTLEDLAEEIEPIFSGKVFVEQFDDTEKYDPPIIIRGYYLLEKKIFRKSKTICTVFHNMITTDGKGNLTVKAIVAKSKAEEIIIKYLEEYSESQDRELFIHEYNKDPYRSKSDVTID